jgi:hypothetical protein
VPPHGRHAIQRFNTYSSEQRLGPFLTSPCPPACPSPEQPPPLEAAVIGPRRRPPLGDAPPAIAATTHQPHPPTLDTGQSLNGVEPEDIAGHRAGTPLIVSHCIQPLPNPCASSRACFSQLRRIASGASRKRAVSDPTVCYPQTRSGQRAASALTHPLLVDPAQGVGLLLERLCGSQLFIHDR